MPSPASIPHVFVRANQRRLFDRLACAAPDGGSLRLSLFGPCNSGRKTLLKALIRRRTDLAGRHYLLFGHHPIAAIRRAFSDPAAKTLICLDFPADRVTTALTQREFTSPSTECLTAWNETDNEEPRLPSDVRLSTSIRLYDEEDQRSLQQEMAEHFLAGQPSAVSFINHYLEDHDLAWYPGQYASFRRILNLMGTHHDEASLREAVSHVDAATDA